VKRENQIDSIRRTIAWFDQYLMGKGAAPDEQPAQGEDDKLSFEPVCYVGARPALGCEATPKSLESS